MSRGRRASLWTTTLVFVLASVVAFARPGDGSAQAEPRFASVDVYVDANGAELAAWQLELTDAYGVARISAVEGGEHPAFADAPHYDPAALQQGRIRLATFRLDGPFPTGRTRVARIHYMVEASDAPQFRVELSVAADPDGTSLDAEVTLE